MSMRYEYEYAQYSFQTAARAAAVRRQFAEMSAAGWRIHTCLPNLHEVAVMWERVVEEPAPAAARSEAHPFPSE